VYERLTQVVEPDAAAPFDLQEATASATRRSARFRVELHLPQGQDITALPLSKLYAELGALGRIEDIQAGSGASGAPALSLFLLTPERQHAIRTKLASLLGTASARVERHDAPPRSMPPVGDRLPTRATGASYGLFTHEHSGTGAYDRSLSSVTQTEALDSSALGRRSIDHDPNRSAFGRRATDRAYFDRSSIRVDVVKVDRLLNLVGELVIAQSMLAEAALLSGAIRDTALRDSVVHVGRQTRDLQEAVMGIRLLPLDFLFSRVPRLVRDLAHKLGKDVELTMHGGEAELDKELIEKLADPLMHLVRNALDHGIESPALREAAAKSRRGSIQLRALHQGGGILVEVQDDGAGFDREKILRKAEERGLHAPPGMSDEEVWQLVFTPGFTTVEEVSDVSGRGVGMDVVKRNIGALSGHIDVRSSPGRGTTIAIRLPLTLAILDGMIVEIGGESFIVPLSFISEAFLPQPGQVKSIASGPQVIQVRESYVPLLDLEPLLHLPREAARAEAGIAIVVEADGRRAALAVERLLGQQQVVIKSLEANYRRVPNIAGATVLGNGRVALILDVNALLRAGLGPVKSMETVDAIDGEG